MQYLLPRWVVDLDLEIDDMMLLKDGKTEIVRFMGQQGIQKELDNSVEWVESIGLELDEGFTYHDENG